MSESEAEFPKKSNQNRQKLQQMLQKDETNLIIDSWNIIISFVLIYAYIHSTYDSVPYYTITWAVFNTLFHLILVIEWGFKLYLAKSYTTYLMTQESIVSICSLIPYFLIKIPTLKLFEEDDDTLNMFANLVCLIRILEFDRLKKYLDSEVNKQLLSILVSIATLVIASAGALYYNALFINTPEKYQFHYFIYFVMTTISTMGYENRFSTAISRVLIIILVIFALTFVPIQSGELIRHLSLKSYYARLTYKASDAIPHIVILGSISTIAGENFFKELFHEDHGLQQKHAVILSPHRPDPVLEDMIRTPQYSNVIYIQGDPHLDKDLRRCQIETAKAIIIMCDKQSADPSAEDSKTILLAIVIKNYLKQNFQGSKIRFCMQLLRQEGKTHYYLSLNKQTKADQVICIEELKMSLLAKACLCPGLIGIISNLITSSGNPPPDLTSRWLKQYWNGQGFEIYKTQLPNYFRGKSFNSTVLILYKRFEVILFGVELITSESERIFLNPGDMQLPTGSSNKLMGYIISQDKETADKIANYRNNDQLNTQKSEGVQRRSTDLRDRRRSRQRTVLQSIQTLFGIKQQPIDKKAMPKITREHTFIMPVRQLGGWIKMKSYNPSSDTIVPNKEQIEQQNQEEEDEQDQQDDFNDMQMKQKLGKDNFRNFLELNLNKQDQKSHLTNEKVNLKAVSFKTLENSILAQNHVILCGLVANLINFVGPLRSKYLETYPPIVILNEIEPSEKQWNQVCYFPEIYFVKGSAMNQRDLIRANLMKATRVVILSPRVEEIKKATFDDDQEQDCPEDLVQQLTKDQEDLLDARTIFKYRNIIRLKSNVQIVTEFVSPQNLQFLLYDKDYALMKEYGFNHTPIFASGQIYISSVMDSLLCQSYYNPALVNVMYQLLVGNMNNPSNSTANVTNNMSVFQQKEMYSDVTSSNLFQMKVPTAFLGKQFEKLFYFLVKNKQIVPLGLYRTPGSQDNKQSYVCTNPEPTTILNSKDIVLILAQELPSPQSINWGGPLEVRQPNIIQTNNMYQKQSTTSSNEPDLILINDDNDKEVQKAKQFNTESEQIIKKIQSTIDEVSKLKSETDDLNKIMRLRQERLIDKMKDIFSEEIGAIIHKRNEISQNLTNKSSDD